MYIIILYVAKLQYSLSKTTTQIVIVVNQVRTIVIVHGLHYCSNIMPASTLSEVLPMKEGLQLAEWQQIRYLVPTHWQLQTSMFTINKHKVYCTQHM